jgi:hypothetical protein
MHAAATQLQQHLHATRQAHQAEALGPPLLLVTTVDIGDGQADRIEVRLGDVPLEVASAFVAKHGLPPPVIPRLAMHLEENLLKIEEQRRAGVSVRGAQEGNAGPGSLQASPKQQQQQGGKRSAGAWLLRLALPGAA